MNFSEVSVKLISDPHIWAGGNALLVECLEQEHEPSTHGKAGCGSMHLVPPALGERGWQWQIHGARGPVCLARLMSTKPSALALKTKAESDGEGQKASLLTLKHMHAPTQCLHVYTYTHEPKISFSFPPL